MNITKIVEGFLQEKIQSEAEVRSKLIVPLLEAMGYPQYLRAEEFPVYGFHGNQKLPTTHADFIMFSSGEFATYRDKSEESRKWVCEHSLLVFEAKKPTETIHVVNQPVFYAAWTRSIAYLISNGKELKGYVVNSNYSDSCVFSCQIEDIPNEWDDILKLSYYELQKRKEESSKNGNWSKRSIYDDYISAMHVLCKEELNTCISRSFEEFVFDLKYEKNGVRKEFDDLIDYRCKVITSEPGGGKTYLMWMLMQQYLNMSKDTEGKIPVLLQGKFYTRVYKSVAEGIYCQLKDLVPSMTIETVEEWLRKGVFVILYDAFDEVEKDDDILADDIQKIRRNTNNAIIVTCRKQNYMGYFNTGFSHYEISPLTKHEIVELLSRFSNNRFNISSYQIPEQLLSVLQIPLFLKMFVSLSKLDEEKYMIPTNYASLFYAYVSERIKQVSCSALDKKRLENTLSAFAVSSYDNDNSIMMLDEVLHKEFEGQILDDQFNKLLKTGLVSVDDNGVWFSHKAIHEFFVALEISNRSDRDLITWLDRVESDARYENIICYLTGIVSNQNKQNTVLDYLETNNLRLFIRALKSRKPFEPEKVTNDKNYAAQYFRQLLNTYRAVVESFFYNIKKEFDGYNDSGAGVVCLQGKLNLKEKKISFVIFNGMSAEIQIDVTIDEGFDISWVSADKRVPIPSSVITWGTIHERYFSLDKLGYGLDSAREIAIEIIKYQLHEMFEKKDFLDPYVEVLLVEKTENELEKIQNLTDRRISLYSYSVDEIISYLSNQIDNQEVVLQAIDLCRVLRTRMNNANQYLNLQGDIAPTPEMWPFSWNDLYSDEQLIKKTTRVLRLTDTAIETVVSTIIPVLKNAYIRNRKIGKIYKNEGYPVVSCLKIKCDLDESIEPILEMTDENDDGMLEDDEGIINRLMSMNKTESDILGSESSDLSLYSRDSIFHFKIYRAVKDLIERIIGKL